MDQKSRIEKLKAEANRLAGGEMVSFGIDEMPPAMAEQFLRQVIAFETAPMVTDFDQLTSAGVPLPEPGTVPDAEMSSVLWRVIKALAKQKVFLARTNHLSDRELYSVLWHDLLREEHAALPEGATGAWHCDIPGDDPQGTNYLSYYASDQERQRWQRDFPEARVPAHREPPYDRDRILPKDED